MGTGSPPSSPPLGFDEGGSELRGRGIDALGIGGEAFLRGPGVTGEDGARRGAGGLQFGRGTRHGRIGLGKRRAGKTERHHDRRERHPSGKSPAHAMPRIRGLV